MKLQDLDGVRRVGQQMSNLCFNLSQQAGHMLTDHDRQLMKAMQLQWDAEIRAFMAKPRRKREHA